MKHSDGDSHENYSSHETTRIEPPIDVSRSRSAVVAFAPSFDFDESPLSSVIETNHENDSWRDRLEGEHYTNIVIDDDVEAGPTPSDVPSGSGDFDNPVRRKGNRRESMVRDLSTGRMGGGRAQSAQLRTLSSRLARPATERNTHRFLRYLGLLNTSNNHQHSDDMDKKEDEHVSKHGRYMVSSRNLDVNGAPDQADRQRNSDRQYRLRAIPAKKSGAKWVRWLGLDPANLTIYEKNDESARGASCSICGVHPSEMVIRFLHWMFRKSLFIVMVTAISSWFALSVLFALFIWIAGRANPGCIGGPKAFGYFSDAFLLSWTTFSTVGYGCIWVGAGTAYAGSDYVWKCASLNFIMIVEAFSGVLFASLISAIMFVKVARVQNVAQVEFCEPICVRFGAAVAIEIANDEAQRGADDDSQSADEPDCCPCPLLEFRVANRMNNIVGGEIIDAMIKVVAVVSEEQGLSFPTRRASKGVPEPLDVSSDEVDPQLKLTYVGALEDDTFYEDQTGHLEPATAFSKVECQTHQHPFFKRVFVVRHKLDQTSPLLKVPIRGMINDNNGNWPQDLKTAHDVRQCLQFDHLLVSLRGTSNAAAKTVHARKVYDHDDLIVGYQFSPMVYRDSSGALQIDMNLINDVAEQVGGGGEDMSAIDSRRN